MISLFNVLLLIGYCYGETTMNFILEGGGSLSSNGVSVSSNSLTLSMSKSPRVYMLDETSSKYKMFDMNNKQLSFDVDLSRVPCDYNLALYFSEMEESAAIGFGYCDAQGQGYSCAEMDIFEANMVSTHLTSHPCNGSTCDKPGVHKRIKFGESEINPANPMNVITKFFTTNNILTSIEQTISQNGKSASTTLSDSGLASMGRSFNNGMVFVASIWTAGAGGMEWLNDKCSAPFSNDVNSIYGIFSNIAVSNIGSSPSLSSIPMMPMMPMSQSPSSSPMSSSMNPMFSMNRSMSVSIGNDIYTCYANQR